MEGTSSSPEKHLALSPSPVPPPPPDPSPQKPTSSGDDEGKTGDESHDDALVTMPSGSDEYNFLFPPNVDHPLSDASLSELSYSYNFPTATTTSTDQFPKLMDPSPKTDQGDANRNPISGYTSKVHVQEKYEIIGFISSGTYGRVYKAVGRDERKREYAIKKFVDPIMAPRKSYPSRSPSLGLNQIRKGRSFNILGSHNQQSVRWRSVPSCPTQMWSNLSKLFLKTSVSTWCLNIPSTIYYRSSTTTHKTIDLQSQPRW